MFAWRQSWHRHIRERDAALASIMASLHAGSRISPADLSACVERSVVFDAADKSDIAWAVREYVAARGLDDTRGCLLELAAVALAAAAALPPA